MACSDDQHAVNEMKESRSTDFIVYAVIAVVIAVAVWAYASQYINPQYGISVSLTAQNQSPATYVYQNRTFIVTVNNTGRSTISDMPLVFYVDNYTYATYQASLPPGKGTAIRVLYNFSEGGNFTFEAIADPARLFSLQDRQSAQSTLDMHVTAPAAPNVYSAIPNENISTTESFTLSQAGIDTMLFMVSKFNLSIFNYFTGGGNRVVVAVLGDLAQEISTMNGAYASYPDSASAYVVWMAGTINPRNINEVVSSFNLPETQITVNGTPATYARLSNSNSLCFFYSSGWTQMMQYDNATSSPRTCASVLSRDYAPSQSNAFVSALKAYPPLKAYQLKFQYQNSTTIGASYIYQDSTYGSLAASQDKFGFFFGVTRRNPVALTPATFTSPCAGLPYAANNLDVCSSYVFQRVGGVGSPFALVNTTEVTANYTLSVYSLVNTSLLIPASSSAEALIASIHANETPLAWASAFKNSCAFANSSIGCSFTSFNSTSLRLGANITDSLPNKLRLNRMACYLGGAINNQTLNATAQPGVPLPIAVSCEKEIIGNLGLSAQTSYTLVLNYTYNGQVRTVSGMLNTTNFG